MGITFAVYSSSAFPSRVSCGDIIELADARVERALNYLSVSSIKFD